MTKSSEKDILLISNEGNQTHFYNDSGIIELSCESNLSFSLDYYWGQENPNGNFLTILSQKTTSNKISVEVNSITDFSIFKCSLYNKNIFLGTASIIIYNSLKKNQLNVISGWDGENVQINKNSIISPIIGTGMIGDNGQFTGITMGTQKTFEEEDKIDYNSGIFGYHNGTRTFFLNSQTGAAIFGSKDSGSIVIDPNENSKQLLMYGSSFWKGDNLTNDGIPIDYNYLTEIDKNDDVINSEKVNTTSNGMLIDFANSCIVFSNGNFIVTPDGILKAKDAVLSGRISSDDSTGSKRVLIDNGSLYIYDASIKKDQNGNDMQNQTGQPIYEILQDNYHKGFSLGAVSSEDNEDRHTVLYSGNPRTGIGIGERFTENSVEDLYTYYECYTNKTNETHGCRHRFSGGRVLIEKGLLVRDNLYLDQNSSIFTSSSLYLDTSSSVYFKIDNSSDPYGLGFRYLNNEEALDLNLEQGLHLGIDTKKLFLCGSSISASSEITVKDSLYLDTGSSVLFKIDNPSDPSDPYAIGLRYLNNEEAQDLNLDQGFHLGVSEKKLCLWGDSITASSAITTTSDRRAKTQIKQLDNRYLQTIKNLNPILFKYKTNNEKIHSGFIAQDVLSIMQKNGISENEWAVVECPKEAGSQYALRYEEFIPALLLYIKSLQKDLNELKKEVEKLK